MTPMRILVADDHEVVRRGLIALLESHPGWVVAGQASNGREAVEAAKRLKPDVVILDISMPVLNGIEATQQILNAVPESAVLALTMHESESLVRRIVKAGALGYVSKSDLACSLIDAVEAVRQHRAFLSPFAATAIVEAYVQEPQPHIEKKERKLLTPREREMLQLVAEGKSTKEAASILDISVYTAETHRRNIMQKLDLHSVSQLTRYAIRNQLSDAGHAQ